MKTAFIALFALSALVVPSAKAMTEQQARNEICAAAQEYIQWGSDLQARQEVRLYAQYLASEVGSSSLSHSLSRHGINCIYY